MNSVFSRICLVPCASSMLFDDGKVHCRVYDLWLLWIYISKLSLESELNFLKYCNIDILTSILMQNKLKCTSRCCVHLMLQKQENWQKTDSPKLFSLRSFYCMVPTMYFNSICILLMQIKNTLGRKKVQD